MRRRPWYLAYIKLLQTKGAANVSSTQIAREISEDSSIIAKYLSFINIEWMTRGGYDITSLEAEPEEFLGSITMHETLSVVVGTL